MTRVVRFHEFGGPEVLRIEEHELPEPGPGEALIDVHSIGVNRSEVNFRLDRYIDHAESLPSGLGYEGTGRVVAVGQGVDQVTPGEDVCVLPVFPQSRYHMYGEQALVPVRALVSRPSRLDAVHGAAAWMPYLTVYGALVDVCRMRAGDHVLITAAETSVGYAGIQIARRVGAIPHVVAETSTYESDLLALGAETVLVAGRDDLVDSVHAATGGRGVSIAFDAYAGEGVHELARLIAPDGILLLHGSLSGQTTPVPGLDRYQALWVRPYSVFDITNDPERFRRALEFVSSGLSAGALAPVIDRVFSFDEIQDAHRRMESPGRFGKIVVTTRHALSG